MSLEIEAKVKVDNLEPYRQLLSRLGFALCEEIDQEDQFFDTDDRSLLKSDRGLRIRRQTSPQSSSTILCFKGPRQPGPFKKREEIELEIDDLQKARRLLELLGYKTIMSVKKKRQTAQIEPCLVCLDEVDQLGSFIEIEGPGEAEITTVLKKLDLDQHPHIPTSYAKMLAEKLSSLNSDSPAG